MFLSSFGGSNRKLNGVPPKSNAQKKRQLFRISMTSNMEKDIKLEFKAPIQNFGDDGNIKIESINEEKSPLSQDKTLIMNKMMVDYGNEYPEEEKILIKPTETVQVEINFGDIKEIEKIAQGSYGIVAKAIHIPSNILIALKKIPINTDEKFQKQVMQELTIMKSIKSDYIVTLFGEYINQGYVHMALEFMDIGTLSKILHQAHIIPENILRIITKQIVLGLHHLHSHHIIHRDLKPTNILINSDGFVKISDFGVSVQCDTSIDARKTFTGTLFYMSPERLKGLNYKFDSDIWSLGIIILECACGYYPIPPPSKESPQKKCPTFWELTTFYDKMNLEDLFLPNFSIDFNRFIHRCLQIDPEERSKTYQLLEDPFIKDIDEVKGQEVIKAWINS